PDRTGLGADDQHAGRAEVVGLDVVPARAVGAGEADRLVVWNARRDPPQLFHLSAASALHSGVTFPNRRRVVAQSAKIRRIWADISGGRATCAAAVGGGGRLCAHPRAGGSLGPGARGESSSEVRT